MRTILFTILVIVAITYLVPRYQENAYDENFIPYGIKAFDVFVYNNNTDTEYYAGRIATDYSNAQMRLSNAQLLAYDFAYDRNLKDWDYLCYTVTEKSNCVTSVK